MINKRTRKQASHRGERESSLLRRCRFEQMEARRMLDANPLLLGAVYTEQDLGTDDHPDLIEVTFEGGEANAEISRIVIDGDQIGNFGNLSGFSSGDIFFDTQNGGRGVDGHQGLSVQLQGRGGGATNAQVTNATVVDGTSLLIVELQNFHAGDRLMLSIDVDEAEVFNPNETDPDAINAGFDPIASGAEFAGSFLTATVAAPRFQDATATATFVNAYDATFARANQLGLTLDLPSDNENSNRDRTAGAIVELEQEPIPVTISGTVFYDRDADLRQEPAEFDRGIADVTLELWRNDGAGYQPVMRNGQVVTALTDAAGDYHFGSSLNLQPGQFQIQQQQPADYVSVGAIPGQVDGSATGVAASANLLTDVIIAAGGQHSGDNDFAETRLASVAGTVYHDRDDDGQIDGNEAGIADAIIQLYDQQGQLIRTTDTDADGRYRFDQLTPGVYSVVEVQPNRWIDGRESLGRVDRLGVGSIPLGSTAADRFDAIFLLAEENAVEFNFGEQLGSLNGRVFSDSNGNCLFEQHEVGIENVEITLIDDAGQRFTTHTNAAGEYRFDDLFRGVYEVVQTQPDEYFHGGQVAGNGGGNASQANQIGAISLGSGEIHLTGYDFCEQLGSLSGFVYHDVNNDGQMSGGGEHGIGGATIQLLRDGSIIATTTTVNDGSYRFDDLAPGEYELRETQPVGWFDGRDTVGQVGNAAVGQASNERIAAIDLRAPTDATQALHGENYNFGERLGALSGYVYHDRDNDGLRDTGAGEQGIGNVEVRLSDASGGLWTTVTNDEGYYQFVGLTPGDYQLREIQPSNWFDGKDTVGTINGAPVGVSGNDQLTQIVLAPTSSADLAAVEYNFGERQGSLSGNVYHDLDNDGVWDAGEDAIANVRVVLTNGSGVSRETVTNQAGHYVFHDLAPGVYSIDEVQPEGWIDGKETLGAVSAGAAGTVQPDRFQGIELVTSDTAIHGEQFNFAERKGSISGIVHTDTNGNCVFDGGAEELLSGVTLQLINNSGELIATTETDANGVYRFDNLGPEKYFVIEEQPVGLFQGGQVLGSHGGNNSVEDVLGNLIVNTDAVHLTDYNFCEAPPSSLSGYVFQDGPPLETADGSPPENIRHFRDGRRTPDDVPLAGVVLELRDGLTGQPIDASAALPGTYDSGPIRTTTDAEGFYQFVGLRGGASYAVFQIQPDNYIDGIDTPGTTTGLAINRGDNISALVLSQLTTNPNDDAIIRIPLAVGQSSEQNNFSEILTTFAPPPPEPPLPPDPPKVFREPPAPEVLPVFFTPQGPTKTDIPVFVTGGAIEVTWHLSVINNGAPRGTQLDNATASNHADTTPASESLRWDPGAMRSAVWSKFDPHTSPLPLGESIFGAANGIPVAGDFNGDGISELGVFIDGHWYLDADGDGVWSEQDLWAKLGDGGDLPVAGDWDGDGKDDIGIFGPIWAGDPRAIELERGVPDVANRQTVPPKNVPPTREEATDGERLLQKTERGAVRSDLIDHVFRFGSQGDRPIAGDFNGDGVSTVGVFSNGSWKLDANGDGRWRAEDDELVEFGQAGDIPLVVDFDGNGVDELSVLRDGRWMIDSDGDRELTAHDRVFELEGRGLPVIGDWDGDGRDEIGFVSPGESRDL